MSWWGGKKGDDTSSSSSSIGGSSSPSGTTYGGGGSDSFGGGDDHYSNSSMSSSGGGGAGGLAGLEEFSQLLSQQVLVNNLITEIADEAFVKCITARPSDSMLATKEVSCIHATVNKWMDTAEFMLGRLSKKQQRASSSGGGF